MIFLVELLSVSVCLFGSLQLKYVKIKTRINFLQKQCGQWDDHGIYDLKNVYLLH